MVTKKAVDQALVMVTEGMLLKHAAVSLGLPLSSLYRYLRGDLSIWENYRRARELGANAHAEDAVDIADNDSDPRRARNRINVRQWLAAKLDPKTYGDKLDLQVTTKVDLRGAMADAAARKTAALRPMSDQRNVIDAVIVDKSISNGARSGDNESTTPSVVAETPAEKSAEAPDIFSLT